MNKTEKLVEKLIKVLQSEYVNIYGIMGDKYKKKLL